MAPVVERECARISKFNFAENARSISLQRVEAGMRCVASLKLPAYLEALDTLE